MMLRTTIFALILLTGCAEHAQTPATNAEGLQQNVPAWVAERASDENQTKQRGIHVSAWLAEGVTTELVPASQPQLVLRAEQLDELLVEWKAVKAKPQRFPALKTSGTEAGMALFSRGEEDLGLAVAADQMTETNATIRYEIWHTASASPWNMAGSVQLKPDQAVVCQTMSGDQPIMAVLKLEGFVE